MGLIKAIKEEIKYRKNFKGKSLSQILINKSKKMELMKIYTFKKLPKCYTKNFKNKFGEILSYRFHTDRGLTRVTHPDWEFKKNIILLEGWFQNHLIILVKCIKQIFLNLPRNILCYKR